MNLDKLDAYEIKDLIVAISGQHNDISVEVHESVDSTNNYLLNLICNSQDQLPKTAVLAEMQTAGKGRLGRTWVSPPGNIYLSLYWPFTCGLEQLYGLSLVAGIAIGRVLRANGLQDVYLKWPNDIFWQDRKMGGILIETKASKTGQVDCVIGIGLNMQSMEAYCAQINQKFVDLASALQHNLHRNKLIAQLLLELSTVINDFTKHGFDRFTEEWHTWDNSKQALQS